MDIPQNLYKKDKKRNKESVFEEEDKWYEIGILEVNEEKPWKFMEQENLAQIFEIRKDGLILYQNNDTGIKQVMIRNKADEYIIYSNIPYEEINFDSDILKGNAPRNVIIEALNKRGELEEDMSKYICVSKIYNDDSSDNYNRILPQIVYHDANETIDIWNSSNMDIQNKRYNENQLLNNIIGGKKGKKTIDDIRVRNSLLIKELIENGKVNLIELNDSINRANTFFSEMEI